MAYEIELNTAMHIAKEAGVKLAELYFSGDVQMKTKKDGTPVTNLDLLANELIVEELQKEFPPYGVVSEEMQNIPGNKDTPTFYIDPVDGTRGLISRSGHSVIHIGLADKGEPVVGIIHHFQTGEMLVAAKGWGAYQISPSGVHKKLEVNPEYDINDLVFSQRESDFYEAKRRESLTQLQPNRKRIIYTGSQGLRMVKVAQNIADAHMLNDKNNCKTWDVCAPHAIAKMAGAYLKCWDGSELTYQGQERINKGFVLASSEGLAKKIQESLKERF